MHSPVLALFLCYPPRQKETLISPAANITAPWLHTVFVCLFFFFVVPANRLIGCSRGAGRLDRCVVSPREKGSANTTVCLLWDRNPTRWENTNTNKRRSWETSIASPSSRRAAGAARVRFEYTRTGRQNVAVLTKRVHSSTSCCLAWAARRRHGRRIHHAYIHAALYHSFHR